MQQHRKAGAAMLPQTDTFYKETNKQLVLILCWINKKAPMI